MKKHLEAAVWGAIIGATAGAFQRGRDQLRKVNFYEPIPHQMASSEILDTWWVWTDHYRQSKPPAALGESFLWGVNYLTEETAFGVRNIKAGISAPMAGSFQNPVSQGSQAFGRTAVWGLLCATADETARYAYFDASIDHDGLALDLTVATAVLVSLAQNVNTVDELLATFTLYISGHKEMERFLYVVNAQPLADGIEKAWPNAIYNFRNSDIYDAVRTFFAILLAVRFSEGKFDAGIRFASGFGGAADHVAIVTGAILGLINESVEEDWRQPIEPQFVAGHGISNDQPPGTIQEFITSISDASRCLRLEVASEPAEGEQAVITYQKPPVIPVSASTKTLFLSLTRSSCWSHGDVLVSASYLSDLVVRKERGCELLLSFQNMGENEQILDPQLTCCDNLKIASKLTSFRLRPGDKSDFPLIVACNDPQGELTCQLALGEHKMQIPFRNPVSWYVCGPFANTEGDAYGKQFKAEDQLTQSAVFNGRSNLPIKWQLQEFPGIRFELEYLFHDNPGACYLAANLKLKPGQRIRMVVSTTTGAVVTVNREQIIRYKDTQFPSGRAVLPYAGEFVSMENNSVIIKLLRDKTPLDSTLVYFLSETGEVLDRIGWTPFDD